MTNREPLGKVIFKDGHEEPIIAVVLANDINHMLVHTPSGKYFYENRGYEWTFYTAGNERWYTDDGIKCFEIYNKIGE